MYFCSIFPSSEKTAPLNANNSEAQMIKSLNRTPQGEIYIEHSDNFDRSKYRRLLPHVFESTIVCWLAIRLFLFDTSVSLAIVYNTSTIPYAACYLRLYVDENQIVREMRSFGTLKNIDKWCDFINCAAVLCVRGGRGTIIKESHLPWGELNHMTHNISNLSKAASFKKIVETLHTIESQDGLLSKGLCFHPSLGRIVLDYDRQIIDFPHAGNKREDSYCFKKNPFGILRVSTLEQSTLHEAIRLFAHMSRSPSKISPISHLLYTSCMLMLVSDDIAGLLHYAPPHNEDIVVIRSIQALQNLSYRTVHMASVVVISDALRVEDLISHEVTTTRLFAEAFYRCNPRDYMLPLTFSTDNLKRFFIARFPREANWVVPVQLISWERMILVSSTKWHRHPLMTLFESRKRWLIYNDLLSDLGDFGLSANKVDHIANQLNIKELVEAPLDLIAIFARSMLTLKSPLQSISVHDLAYDLYPYEINIRARASTMLGVSDSSDYDIDHKRHEELFASLYGLPVKDLNELVRRYGKTESLGFLQSQIRKLQQPSSEECCVCMTEQPSVITLCGHLYCAECCRVISSGGSSVDAVKCGACRTTLTSSEWWKLNEENTKDKRVMSIATALKECTSSRIAVLTPTREHANSLRNTLNHHYGGLDTHPGFWYYPHDAVTVISICDATIEILREIDSVYLVFSNQPCVDYTISACTSWDEAIWRFLHEWTIENTARNIFVVREKTQESACDKNGRTLLHRLQKHFARNDDVHGSADNDDNDEDNEDQGSPQRHRVQRFPHGYQLRKRRLETL